MENYDEEGQPSNAKVVTGIRTFPALKMELNQESAARGQTTSEYGEVILLNRHKDKAEIERLKQIITEREKKIEELNLQQVIFKGKHADEFNQYKSQFEQICKNIDDQKQLVNELSAENEILRDKRLLYLFEHVRGMSDTVKDAYAENFGITYNTPKEVLLALIYSTKLNT